MSNGLTDSLLREIADLCITVLMSYDSMEKVQTKEDGHLDERMKVRKIIISVAVALAVAVAIVVVVTAAVLVP